MMKWTNTRNYTVPKENTKQIDLHAREISMFKQGKAFQKNTAMPLVMRLQTKIKAFK